MVRGFLLRFCLAYVKHVYDHFEVQPRVPSGVFWDGNRV